MAAESVQVRPALPADLAALVALEQRMFAGDRLSRRQYRRHLHSATAQILVGEHRGVVVGSLVLLLRRDVRDARLYSLARAPETRGLGVGAALLHAAEGIAIERGYAGVRLEVRDDNAPAIALYERAGYALLQRRGRYYEDGMDARLYRKSLEV